MRRLWNEFKSFAMSGNMLDLALGFIIGAAFAKIIESLVQNVMMQLVASIFEKPDFTELYLPIHGGRIAYGKFLTDLVNFLLLAALLFGVVKFIVFVGVGRGRAFGTQECPYCQEQVAPTALVCRFCRQQLVDELPSLADARARLEELKKRKLPVPLPSLARLPGIAGLPSIAVLPGRRKARGTSDADPIPPADPADPDTDLAVPAAVLIASAAVDSDPIASDFADADPTESPAAEDPLASDAVGTDAPSSAPVDSDVAPAAADESNPSSRS
jgi:large conductance mechanosensitive channel